MADSEKSCDLCPLNPPASPPPPGCSLLAWALGKRVTWVALFLLAYGLLLSCSWTLLHSVSRWYESKACTARGGVWPAVYASVVYGGVFGLLSMGAALAVAVPATVTTWITVVVLLAFAGKPRGRVVAEGRRITSEIAGFTLRVVVREGNAVAAASAALSYFALFRRRSLEDDQ